MIGTIIPPFQIKRVVQKTAQHVAQNGSSFEKVLLQVEQSKAQFSFLNKDNPYRAYYDHMVAEYSRRLMVESQGAHQIQGEQVKEQVKILEKEIQVEEREDEQAVFLEKVFEEVKEPDPERYSVDIPEKMSKGDMAMIQHTAQYVAIKGKNFLIALSEREKNNPQFQFLKSSSDFYEYFTKMVAAYSLLIELSEEQISKLSEYANNKQAILQKCEQVYKYHKLKQQNNKGKKQTKNKVKQSTVDWNDFELVQTIIFDDFKPNRGYSQQFKLNKPLFSNKNLQQKIISEPKRKQLLQQCSVCKQKILATQMTKHLKSCISGKSTNNTSNNNNPNFPNSSGQAVDVSKNLQNLSMRRPDIFGGEGQAIRKQQQPKEQAVIWDGQAANMSRTTASIAMMQNIKNKQKEQNNK